MISPSRKTKCSVNNGYCPVELPYPGRRARRVERVILAVAFIILAVTGTVSHLLPAILSADSTPGGELRLEQTEGGRNRLLNHGPGVPLPPGTVQFGSRDKPTTTQVVDNSFPPRLAESADAWVYQTPFGQYSFNRTFPFLFSLRSQLGTLLTKGSIFFVRTGAPLIPGRTNATLATDNSFRVTYEVLLNSTVVGHIELQADFQATKRPKFTILFSKVPAWNLGDFNVLWSTLAVPSWLKSSDAGPSLNVQALASRQAISGISSVDLGGSEDSKSWREWVTTDWTDAPGGRLEVDDITLSVLNGRGISVVFPTNQAIIDPTQVATSTSSFATGYSTQRKTFNYGRYYFLFWYNGSNIVYSTSPNSLTWSIVHSTGSGQLNYGFDIYNSGSTVAMTWLNYSSSLGGDGVSHLLFRKGSVIGDSIAWDPVRVVVALPQPYSWPPSVAIGTDGRFWAAGVESCGTANCVRIYTSTDGQTFGFSAAHLTSNIGSRYEAVQLVPLLNGKLMVLSSHYSDTTIRWRIWNPVTPTGPSWSSVQSFNVYLPANSDKTNRIAAVSATDGLVHLLTVSPTAHVYYNVTSGLWTYGTTLSSGLGLYPSIASDELGNLYAFHMALFQGVPRELWYNVKPKGQPWSGGYQVFGAGSLINNATWLSATRLAAKQATLAWTLFGTSPAPYRIMYGSIPLPSGVGSAPPSQPWSKLGHFLPNGESVSPGNGLLTIGQADISVPGRNGLDLTIGRLYIQPFTFLAGLPFKYETSPYAVLGDGWQLNLPWVGTQYLHYSNGQLFPLTWSNYTLTTNGSHNVRTWTIENHDGTDFLLSKTEDTDTSAGTTTTTHRLVSEEGTVYNFNGYGLVTSIVDRTGQNQLSFNHFTNPSYTLQNTLQSITDSVGRIAIFRYDDVLPNPRKLANVTYAGQTVRYAYSGNSLASVTDSLQRTISFTTSSWLVLRVTYPTGGFSDYVYGSVNIGTDAVNYYVTSQNVYGGSLIRSASFSYQMTDGTVTYTSITQSDGTTVQGHTKYEFNAQSRSMTVTTLDSANVQMNKVQYWSDANGRPIQEDVYAGNASTRSYFTRRTYDSWSNIVYSRDPLGHETYQSYANTDSQYMFQSPVNLTTTTDGRRLYDDFNIPTLDTGTWVQGGSANVRVTSTSFSQLWLQGSSLVQGMYRSNWVRTSGTFSYPFYAEVQMALGQNPGPESLDAELIISPQVTVPFGDPYVNPDALRIAVASGPYYRVFKNLPGGIPPVSIYDSGLVQGGSLTVSWKIVLTDRNTLTVYLNKGSGYERVNQTTNLGLSNGFTPSYIYLAMQNSNTASHSVSFDYVGLSGSNLVTVNALGVGQKVELYDSNDVLRAIGTVSSGQTSLSLNATTMVFPYGFLKIFGVDGLTVSFISPTGEVWGGSVYSYGGSTKSGGFTRTATGFLKSNSVYFDDDPPLGAFFYSDGGDGWLQAGQPYVPVASGFYSHVGFSAMDQHQHYFNGSSSTISPSPGYFHIQYVYIPSTSIPNEIMLQFHDNDVSNPGFETGNFNSWSQSGVRIRSDVRHRGTYSAAPVYDSANAKYLAFTLQQNLPAPIAGSQVTTIQLWYIYGTNVSDSAQVLYTDGSYTTTLLPYVNNWTLKNLSFDSTKQISAIKVQRSFTVSVDVILDDFVLGGWEHRAYWGDNIIPGGTDGTSSMRPMGTLPAARDSWLMLIVKSDDVATTGRIIDGLAYSLYNGGVYWDYSALGDASTGTLTFNNLPGGWRVDLHDFNGGFVTSGTAPVSPFLSSGTLDVYGAGVNVFPFRGYVIVYDNNGLLQYSSSLMTDIWGGDVYSYNQPIFSNAFEFSSTVGSSIHSALLGQAEHREAGSYVEAYARYDAAGNLLREKQLKDLPSLWIIESKSYDGYGNPTTHTDARGNKAHYVYSSTYQYAYLTNETRRDGITQVTSLYGYNFTNGNLLWIRDPRGYNTTYQYDVLGRVRSVNYPNGIDFVSYAYNDQANYVEITNSNGWRIRQHYDGLGRLVRVERFGVTSAKLRLYNVDSSNSGGDFYKAGNRWTQSTVNWTTAPSTEGAKVASLGAVSKNAWYEVDITSLVTGDGVVSLRVKSASNDGADYSSKEGANPPLLVVTVMNQAQTRVLTFTPTDDAYVEAGRPGNNFGTTATLQVDSSPVKDFLLKFSVTGVGSYSNETTTYDWQNNVAARVDPLGNVTSYQYDYLGRLTSTTKPDLNVTRQFYNDQSSWVRLMDEDQKSRCKIYDRAGRLTQMVENADTNCNATTLAGYLYVTNYTYDKVGNLRTVTAASGQTTAYTYDNLNGLTRITYPDGKVVTYEYDNNGNLVKKIDQNNVKTLYSYDSLNQVKTVTFCGTSTTSNSYSYDLNGNLLTLQNQNATITYTYDDRNRPLTEKYDVNLPTRQVIDLGCSGPGGTSTVTGGLSRTYTVSYSYKGALLETITYPDVPVANIGVKYTYDGLGRVIDVTKSGTTTSYAKFAYYQNDRVKSVTFGNGLIGNYTYDPLARPYSVTLKDGSNVRLSLTYSYNRTGTISSIVGSVNGLPVDERYRYDPLGRLVNATVTSQGTTSNLWYEYDNLSNRRRESSNGLLTSYTYNMADNTLTSTSTGTTYSYDSKGNLQTRNTGSASWTYAWDVAGNMLKVTNGASAQGTYAYDGMGRKVETIEAGSTTFHAYFGTESLFEQIHNLYGVDFIYAAGLRIATVDSSTGSYNAVKYFHTDHLGSTRLVTRQDKSVHFAGSYQPFGQDNGTPTGSNKEKFTGKPWSSSIGLSYYGARWYDPSTGRFISRDPAGGVNPYVYVLNNPTRYIDPDGASPVDSIIHTLERLPIALGLVFSTGLNLADREFGLGSFRAFRILPKPGNGGVAHTLFGVYRPRIPGGQKGEMFLKFDMPDRFPRHQLEQGYHGWSGWWSKYGGRSTRGHFPVPSSVGRVGESILRRPGRVLGAGLAFLGLALSAYDVYSAYQEDTASGNGYGHTFETVAGEAGLWAGAISGCYLGGAIGSVVPGPGTLVGCLVGGLVGGLAGEEAGTGLFRLFAQASWANAPGVVPTYIYQRGYVQPR